MKIPPMILWVEQCLLKWHEDSLWQNRCWDYRIIQLSMTYETEMEFQI
jgi:hypothetical protein